MSPLERDGRPPGLEAWAIGVLEGAFRAADWKVVDSRRRREKAQRADLVCRKGDDAYVVELRASSGPARRAVVRGLLADAILRARAFSHDAGARPLAVVAAPSISDEIAGELAAYVEEFGGGVSWGVMDGRGRLELHGPRLDDVVPPDSLEPIGDRRDVAPPPYNPFTDLGQWMLKVLLAPRIREDWLHAPRERVGGVGELAELAGVSPASASKFVAGLEASGYLERRRRRIELVRFEALLESWRIASQRPAEEHFARFVLPASDALDRIRGALAKRAAKELDSGGASRANENAGPVGQRACLGLFAACRALGLGFVRGAPLHLYLEDPSANSLDELGLLPARSRADADLIVRRPRFPESVFRGCVLVDGGPASDALQCWLDVSSHPARGGEQASELAQHLGFAEWGS